MTDALQPLRDRQIRAMDARVIELLASSAAPELTAAVAVATLEADRIVSGLVLPVGPIGYTSVGPVRLTAANVDRIRLPDDLRRVKLMDYHQTPAVAIGYCTAARWTPEGLRASFTVANTPAGDAALLEVRELVRDGLSVELGAIDVAGDELRGGDVLGVALVPIPAWATARHDGLAAARTEDSTTTTTTGSETPMTPEERARLAELLGMNARTPEEEAEYLTLVRQLATTPDDGTSDPATATGDAQPALAAAHAAPPVAPATVATRRRGSHDIRELFAAQARVLSGTSRPDLEAALADITVGDNIWVGGSEYDGQLWSGLEYQRRFVPLLTPGPLNSRKGNGWRWVTKPEVADYAGDKTAVPSNTPETEATEWTAARLAGAHDIDRAFVDFGDTEFIAAYYAAMTESYAIKSDDKARLFLLAMAAANPAIAGATSLWGAAIRGASAVMDATNGVQPDYFMVSQADMIGLSDDPATSMPDTQLLEVFGVTPDKFIVTPGVAAGTVVSGIKQAARWRELGSTPIRVEAINITNGGVDGGVFGYYATEAVHDGGVQRATFA